MATIPLSALPKLNASLNAACTVFLIAGLAFIKNGKILYHKTCMLLAFLCSTVFLGFYLYFHFHAGIIRFGGTGWVRYAYLTLLTTHTFLAVLSLPFIIVTLSYALSEKFNSHRKIAHWTYPIWMYVSVTGVIVYYMLYIAYTPIGAPWLTR
jgi:uncharacterized membrane protein YozB (DUF420 family)